MSVTSSEHFNIRPHLMVVSLNSSGVITDGLLCVCRERGRKIGTVGLTIVHTQDQFFDQLQSSLTIVV